ncbi:MAG: pentapeptide repeat-containing protein [Enterobacteriaceae bacterium]
MTDTNLSQADLSRAKLNGTHLERANLTEAGMYQTDLRQANLTGADLTRCNFIEADLSGLDLAGSIMTEAILQDATLIRTNLEKSHLESAILTGACLNWTDFSGADLNRADMTKVRLDGANFNGANLADTVITLNFPEKWYTNDLDLALNHRNNQRSLLTTIDSIDNAYPHLKMALVAQLLTALEKIDYPQRLRAFAENYLLLLHPNYHTAEPSEASHVKVIDHFLRKHMTQSIIDLANRIAWLNITPYTAHYFLQYVMHQSARDKFALNNSMFFCNSS